MNMFFKLVLLASALALMTACASGARLKTDYDAHADFNAFKTYDFSSPTEIENPGFSDTVRLYYSAAIEQQLLRMDYARSDTPDLLIDVSVSLESRTSAPKIASRRYDLPYNTSITACPGSGDYNGQVAGPPSSAGSRPTVCRFEEGTVEVEVAGPKEGRTLWTAQLLVRIDPDERYAYLMQNIVNDTAAMLADAPFVNWSEAGRQ